MSWDKNIKDEWLGGEAWSMGIPSMFYSAPSFTISPKTELLKDLILLTVRLEDLAKDLDEIRERLGEL